MTTRSYFEKSYPSERPELLELLKKFKCIIDTLHYYTFKEFIMSTIMTY